VEENEKFALAPQQHDAWQWILEYSGESELLAVEEVRYVVSQVFVSSKSQREFISLLVAEKLLIEAGSEYLVMKNRVVYRETGCITKARGTRQNIHIQSGAVLYRFGAFIDPSEHKRLREKGKAQKRRRI